MINPFLTATAHTTRRLTAVALTVVLALSACSSATTTAPAREGTGRVTVDNCGTDVSFPAPAQRMFVNDVNLVAFALALGAQDQITAVSSLQDNKDVLTRKYGDVVGALNDVSAEQPSLETVLAARPDVMVAGWNYGYRESTNLTPQTLADHDVAAYVLSESCRQSGGARGTMDPWDAVRTDLRNLGSITGRSDTAEQVLTDTDERLAALQAAPQPAKKPVVFVFDSGTDAIFSSGAFGGPQAVIEAAGGTNALSDIEDSWTEVTWEKLATAKPDMIVFVDYPGQTVEEKQAVLAAHPASRTLEAVKNRRFLTLPYALWTSSPLNIDAAEHVRKGLESYDLVPASSVSPQLDLD